MCGIAGSLGEGDGSRMRRMTGALVHRGPDSSGYHSRGELHLGARRLSIVGIASGDQPIYNEAGDKAIVFNGEIYNYRQLQKLLREKGHKLATATDSEVVLHLYEEYGRDCVQHLRGMFAFAIDDGGALFLARDRLGIKPLYYAHLADRGLFLFASEIKALLRCPEVSTALDFESVLDSVICSYPVGSRTLFEDVRCLDPGCALEVSKAGGRLEIRQRRYYEPRIEPDPSITTFEEAEASLYELLRETVQGHLSGDVEVGLLLSGGLDSSLLAALMAECLQEPFAAYTIATEESSPDLASAREVAARLGLRHEVLIPTFEEYLAAIPDWLALRETALPSLSGLSALLLSRRIAQRLKVCISGDGSDEIFGGYAEFYGEVEGLRRLRRNLSRFRALGYRPSAEVSEMIGRLFAEPDQGSDAFLLGLFRYNQGDVLVRQHLDFQDGVGMAASLEIRVPFMDHVLVELANRLPLRLKVTTPPRVGKYILRRLITHRFATTIGDIVTRPKLGMPSACTRYKERFEALCNELLPIDYLGRHELGCIFPSRVRLLLFELFQAVFVDSRGEAPANLDVVDFIRSRADATPPLRASVPVAMAPSSTETRA
ncbi:MAG TPA: asparagine synthase (glutamine-hydrolyzing) [Thermoanaerobaculia bacterium]|jgi:asparagine synthase (glutamine-hydrolysing)